MKRIFAAVTLVIMLAAFTAPAGAQAVPRATCAGKTATVQWDGRSVDRWGNRIIQGTAGADVIVGTSKADHIYADGGVDLVCALGGDDVVYGDQNLRDSDQGYGGDTIYGGGGDDLLMGEAGDDILYGQGGNDILLGDRHGWKVGPRDRGIGGAGSDVCRDDVEIQRSCEVPITGGAK